jgi:hypothetical protein
MLIFQISSKLKRFNSRTSTDEIKVLTVKNGNGEELKDARFVEVLRSARQRIKSATEEGI